MSEKIPERIDTDPTKLGAAVLTERVSINESKPTTLEMIREVLRKPYSKAAILASTLTFMAGGAAHRIEQFDFSGEKGQPAAELVLPTGEHISFVQWQDFKAQKAEHIKPSNEINELVTNRDALYDYYRIDPNRVENKEKFTNWVQDQLQTEVVRQSIGKAPEKMDAKDLVEASAVITIANLKWTEGTDQLLEALKAPMDKFIMESLPSDCVGYSAAMQTIFNTLKEIYPDKLANTYVVENGSDELGHFYDSVVQVDSSTEAQVSFIDPTAEDPDYHPIDPSERDLATLLDGLSDRGVISKQTAVKLARSSGIPTQEVTKYDY